MDATTLAAGLAGAGLIWTIIWSIYSTNRLNKIQADVTRNSRLHDQSVQRLYRAREAVIGVHKAYVYLGEYVQSGIERGDDYFTKHAELSAAKAELRGIAFAVNDQQLLDLVNSPKKTDTDNWVISEMDMRGSSQQLHTRITELLEMAT